MPKLKTLSGDEVIKIFENFGFSIVGQKGSHIKLRRINDVNSCLMIRGRSRVEPCILPKTKNENFFLGVDFYFR